MGLREKLKKIKENCARKEFILPENEKTGVVNGLLLLGAAVGTLLSLQHSADAAGTPCVDTVNQKVTDTGNTAQDSGLDVSGWQDHSWHDHNWWDHCWWDHSWWDFSDFSDGGGG